MALLFNFGSKYENIVNKNRHKKVIESYQRQNLDTNEPLQGKQAWT